MSKLIDKRMTLLICSQFISVGLGILYLKASNFSINNENFIPRINKVSGIGEKTILKDVGVKLKTIGLNNQAIKMLKASLTNYSYKQMYPEASNIAFSIAELLEKEGEYKKAISYYFQVEMFNDKSINVSQAKKKIVALLERLKKFSASKMILSESVSLDKKKAQKVDDVVAIVANENISLGELNEKFDSIPSSMKKQFHGLEGKKVFLQKMVADKLISQSAKRAGYDLSQEYLSHLEKIKDQLLIQIYLKKEFSASKIDQVDLVNFYNINKKKYMKKGVVPKLNKVLTQVQNAYLAQKAQSKYQKLIKQLMKNEKVQLFMKKVK